MSKSIINELNSQLSDKFLIFRAVLCLIVFGTHIPKQLWNINIGPASFNIAFLFSGHIAVVIFMILSGYLIGKQFLIGKYEITFEGLKKYYKARFKRIVPIYYISILIGVMFLDSNISANPNFGTKLVQSFLFLYDIDSTPYFVNGFWSLSVEVQFYLFAPLIFWITRRFYVQNRKSTTSNSLQCLIKFAFLTFLIFSFDLFARRFLVSAINISQLRHFLIHISYLIFGLSLNFISFSVIKFINKFDIKSRVFSFWSLFVLILLALAYQNYISIRLQKDSFDGFIFIYIISIISGLLILLGETINSIKTKFIQTNYTLTGLLEKLGLISYPFYLIHLIVIKSLPIQTPFFILISFGISIISSFVLEISIRKVINYLS
jgi:peptidoglycan/LPS O-acetylase OafA/YrhL